MPADGTPAGLAVHATAVAIGARALLISGRSRAGKSRLAAALVAASTPRRRIVLVGDDRVILSRTALGLVARPHPRIAGFLERRGLGVVAVPWRARATVAGVAMLDDDVAPYPARLENLPALRLVGCDDAARAGAVLAWWPTAARKRHRDAMFATPRLSEGEDWNW